MDSLLYLLMEFREKLRSKNTTARYVRCWLADGSDVIKHDECVGMCLFPDEVREFLSYGVYYTVSFPFCFLHYLLSEANAVVSDFPEIAKILSNSTSSVIAHLMSTYHFCESTAISMITKLVSGEDALEEWSVSDDRLASVKSEIACLVEMASQATGSTSVYRTVYYGTRSQIIHMAARVQDQCDARVLPFEFGLLVPVAQKDVVLAYLSAYLASHPHFAGMRVEATMKLPPLLQLEDWDGEGVAFSQEELARRAGQGKQAAFEYLDAYFVAVRGSSRLLFVDYMHQAVRFLATRWELLDFVGFALFPLLSAWREQTARVVGGVVSVPFVGPFSLQQAVARDQFNTFFGMNPRCFAGVWESSVRHPRVLQQAQEVRSHHSSVMCFDRCSDNCMAEEMRECMAEQLQEHMAEQLQERMAEETQEQTLAMHLFRKLCLSVGESRTECAAWLRQFIIQMLTQPNHKPSRGVVLLDEQRVFAEELLRALQCLFTFSTAVCVDAAGRRRQRRRDHVSRALLVHYHSDREITPEAMEWLCELVRLKHRVDFSSEDDVCVRPAYCRVVVTAARLQCVPFFSLRDRASFAYFLTDTTAMTREELAVFSSLRRRAWFPAVLFRALMEEGLQRWDWRAVEKTRLAEALVCHRVDSPVLFAFEYLKCGSKCISKHDNKCNSKHDNKHDSKNDCNCNCKCELRSAKDFYKEYVQYCAETRRKAVDFLGFVRCVLVEFYPQVDYAIEEGRQQFVIHREEEWLSPPPLSQKGRATLRAVDQSSNESFVASSACFVC